MYNKILKLFFPGKTFEAKADKTQIISKIMGQYISNNQLMNLIKPYADKLKAFSTHKNIHKIKVGSSNRGRDKDICRFVWIPSIF